MLSIASRIDTLRLKDGLQLKSNIWFPTKEGTWPALLMRQPYGKEIASTVTYLHPSWWASQGYLVVIQDVRGQGSSEGTFSGFEQESSDTSDTHEWVRSLPECNGLLGTYGFSYQGLTQLTAEEGTKPPDCLAPAMTGIDERDHWCSEGGAFWWHIGLAWGLQLASLKARRESNFNGWEEIRRSLEDKSYLREGPFLLEKYDPEGMVYSWLRKSNVRDAEWAHHMPLNTWLKQPMLLLGGWWDPHLRGILDLYVRSLAAGGNPNLHIGPATHLKWWKDSQQIQLDFFNLHLKGISGLEGKKNTKLFWNLTSNTWQQPSQSTFPSRWGLLSFGSACLDSIDGNLKPDCPGEGFQEIVHDPWRPVPAIGGHLSPDPGPANRNEVDLRGDVATFTSKPLTDDFHLEGTPQLDLEVNADQAGFDLFAAISIIKAGQTEVEQLSTGVIRVLQKSGSSSTKRIINLQPLVAEFQRGDRIRISISGSAWPAIGINPGKENSPCGAPSPHCLIVTISLDLTKSKFQISPLLPTEGLQDTLNSV